MIDNELMFWDKVEAASAVISEEVDLGSFNVGYNEPIRVFLYVSKKILLALGHVSIDVQGYDGVWITLQVQHISQAVFDVTRKVVFSLPSYIGSRCRLQISGTNKFTAGTLSVGINIDQQLNG